MVAIYLSGATSPVYAQEENASKPVVVPLFRHIDPTKKDPDFKAYQVIRFSVTDDFPPFSYRTGNGALTGFNIAVANAMCRILRIECLFSVKPFRLIRPTRRLKTKKLMLFLPALLKPPKQQKHCRLPVRIIGFRRGLPCAKFQPSKPITRAPWPENGSGRLPAPSMQHF